MSTMPGRRASAIGRAVVIGLTAGAVAFAGLVALSPMSAIAASSPGLLDTGDPPPPADHTVPDGLDDPAPVPDESIVEMPPAASPSIVPNANTVRMAWVGTPDQRPADAALLTLQAALNAVPAGGTVSFDPDAYAFTGALTVPRLTTLASASAATLYARFTVSGGGLTLGAGVGIAAANTGAIVSVTASGAVLTGLVIRNPTPVLRPTGVQLGAGVTGVQIVSLDMDGAGEPSSYGINLTTGSATVADPRIAGVATGVIATAASTAADVAVSGGTISAATSGISLGATQAPSVSGVEVTGATGVGTGIDLAQSTGAVVASATVHGFARGIGTATTNTGTGPAITDAVIDGSSREGIALGATSAPRVERATIAGTDTAQSTGILVLLSNAATITEPRISGMMYGITTSALNTGTGPAIAAPQITAFGGITLGSTQGASVTDAVIQSGAAVGGTGVNLVNSGRATVTDLTATGFLYAVGSQSTIDPASDRVDITISDVTVTGAPVASHGIYLLGVSDATITGVEADITGAALVIHQSQGVVAQNVVVTGHEGPTPTTGSAILRAYGSQRVDVSDSSIAGGSYGFFYSATQGSRITNATVADLVEYGVYGRSVSELDVSGVTFRGNSAVGLLVATEPANGLSHDIALHDNTMVDNDDGISLFQGTSDVDIVRNAISGQRTALTAGSAHGVTFADNTVDQAAVDGMAALTIAPRWQDAEVPGSYSSSAIRVTDNTFRGTGTWISVGTADATDPEADRRTLQDAVLVTGNVFPAASTAIVTHPNAVIGDDTAAQNAVSPFIVGVDGPIAVDARDHDDPNDWGSRCRATGFLDGEPYYDGGGAEVRELSDAPVLYPMNCVDLSLTEALAATDPVAAGDTVTWMLTPHNDGPRAAPAGWTVQQLLPEGVELVSLRGDRYDIDGLTATAQSDLPAGEDGPPLMVTVRIVAPPSGAATMRNVAYIAPAPDTDLDGDGFVDLMIEQFSPLAVPTIDTDTDATETDNDTQGVWAVAPSGSSGGGSGGGGSGGGGSGGGAGPGSGALPATGADSTGLLLLGGALAVAGLLILSARRFQRPRV